MPCVWKFLHHEPNYSDSLGNLQRSMLTKLLKAFLINRTWKTQIGRESTFQEVFYILTYLQTNKQPTKQRGMALNGSGPSPLTALITAPPKAGM